MEEKNNFKTLLNEIGVNYATIILKKIQDEKNHSGENFQELNEGIRILNHINGMIGKAGY